MSKELIVSSTPHETKVAIVEEDQVVEVYFEREQDYSLAGSVYKGRVTRVLPGMQSAFVDVGLERDAFLYVSDFFEDTEEYEQVVTTAEEKVSKMEQERGVTELPAANLPTAPAPEAPAAAWESAEPPRPSDHEIAERVPEGPRRHRSRRRRSRGKGFPQSKYAGEVGGALERSEPPASSPASLLPQAEVLGPAILPGESLAKYRDQRPPMASDEERFLREESAAQVTPRPALQPEPVSETAGEPPPALPQPEPLAEEESATLAAPATEDVLPAVSAPGQTSAEASGQATSMLTPRAGAGPAVGPQAMAAESKSEEAPSSDTLALSEPAAPVVSMAGSDSESGPIPAAQEAEGSPASGEVRVREPAEMPRYSRQFSRRMRRRMMKERRADGRQEGAAPEAPRPARGQPLIGELLREGQEIIVQIAKEPIGKKGARITSHIALPGRYLVYMPTVDHIGVSRRIASDEERQRLKRLLMDYRRSLNMPGGFIVRTAAEGHSEQELRADLEFLFNLWREIRAQAERSSAPALLHRDLSLVERILRDQLSGSFTAIWVDNESEYARILEFVQNFQPALVGRAKLYLKETPIFEEFGVQEEINKSLKPKVWLKSGGYIVINQTEALVAIDVNTGKYVGRTQRLEDTIVKTNVDAIREIVRQIRLRDLGGIIVIDFIDMDERKNRQRVMQALEEALRQDRAPSKALAFNDFGLVAITRKRIKQPLERALGCACPYCSGSGFVKNPQTVSLEILGEVKRMLPNLERREITVRVNPEVARYLKQRQVTIVQEIEELARKTVIIKSDPSLHQENFDIH